MVQQLAALSVGQKLKLTVDSVTDSEVTFKSDDVHSATVQASKHHVTGEGLENGSPGFLSQNHWMLLNYK